MELAVLKARYERIMDRAIDKQALKAKYVAIMLEAMNNPALREKYVKQLSMQEEQKESAIGATVKSIKEQIEECKTRLYNLFLMDKLQGETN